LRDDWKELRTQRDVNAVVIQKARQNPGDVFGFDNRQTALLLLPDENSWRQLSVGNLI
jgi:hypothetical protein